jgi:hypothetical protein
MRVRSIACCVLGMWSLATTAQMQTSGTTSRPAAPAITPSNTVPRARDLGVPFDGTPGPLNAITDVAGLEVGYKTLISGEGPLVIGKGPVRTGVTAILPRGKQSTKSVFAGYFAGNGNGDMTGTHWIEESGLLETPILITNTGSVGVVRDAAVAWMVHRKRPGDFWYPVTAETADELPLTGTYLERGLFAAGEFCAQLSRRSGRWWLELRRHLAQVGGCALGAMACASSKPEFLC